MPYKIPALAGKPYRPSNGTEGEMFQEQFCNGCIYDAAIKGPDPDWSKGCQILAATFCFDIDEPEYPKEWVHDADGRPTCTKFTPDQD